MAKKENSKEKNKNSFFKDVKLEMKKVTWPTFKKLVNNTTAVISIVLVVAVIVFILDVCFEKLNDLGVGTLKSLVSTTEESTDETTDESADESTDETIDVDDITEVETTEETEGTDINVETEGTEVTGLEENTTSAETENVEEVIE